MQPQFTTKAIKRFWSKVDKSGECWLWQRSATSAGYGHLTVAGIPYYAHRFAYIITYGEPLEDKPFVCHSCDVNYPVGDISYRRCVRPDHLFAGTQKDNITDAVSKGRMAKAGRRGERHWKAKLSESQVLAIREGAATGQPQASLARKYGCSHATINLIVTGKRWRHLL